MSPFEQTWEALDAQMPLCEVPRRFAGMGADHARLEYLKTVLQLCPQGARTCEMGIEHGFDAVWLSLRGIAAEGVGRDPRLVERARQINHLLGGTATFRTGDLFHSDQEHRRRYQVIHHRGVLAHCPRPQIQALLAQQVASACWVVLSVPSAYAPLDPAFDDARLLTLEEWERMLAPFDLSELRYYGNPDQGERDHVLCVLRGQEPDDALSALIQAVEEPYPEGITAIVHTRNEAHQIADCLQTLQDWADQIIVCDMESEDDTVGIARQFTEEIMTYPRLLNFDRARNMSAMRARFRWVFYLDADERVPPGLGPLLRNMVAAEGSRFEAMCLPCRHYFAGHWMQCLYPGYKGPQLLKNGQFVFSARLHAGARVQGRTWLFSAENPDLALEHYSYTSLSHYLEKLNRYTDGEAENLHRDGQPFHWQNAIRHFVHDFQAYYDHGGAPRDGVYGFLYAFLGAFYRFEQHAKLYERRVHQGQVQPPEEAVPSDALQVLEYALSVAREKPLPGVPELQVRAASDAALLVWSGPLLHPSGYGEDCRHLLLAAEEAGVPVGAHPIPWDGGRAALSTPEQAQLQALTGKPALPGFVSVTENFAPHLERHPEASAAIGRTFFETDRLPRSWVPACNRMDYVWVPSAFHRQAFAAAGVAQEKLVVIPGCFDPTPYAQRHPAPATLTARVGEGRFVFLSIFDWSLHKGWDALLQAFLEAFADEDRVALVFKVWSSLGYTPDQIREQAQEQARRIGCDLRHDPRVSFLQERLDRTGMAGLYQNVDAFVLASRGEGWGRPYMEAMACGLPVIGTGWSGNTEFMTPENSYLIDCAVGPVPEAGWREIPAYQGHRWAEPSVAHLKELLRRVFEERGEAACIGARAREEVTAEFSYRPVGKRIAAEFERVWERHHPHPLALSQAGERRAGGSVAPASEAAPLRVRWEGAQFSWHSLAHVNRELCRRLLAQDNLELSLIPTEPAQFHPAEEPRFQGLAERCFAPLSGPADIHVRHLFPPRWEPPEEGRFVLMQPWEFGFLPRDWISPIQKQVCEAWYNSRYEREVYLNSGIPEAKLHYVPLGVETAVFHPQALPYVFTAEPGAASLVEATRDRFLFLFVGGTLFRKGIDILLETYVKAFSAADAVGLVIKDTGTQTVYRGMNARDRILSLAGDRARPGIIYLEQDLSLPELAGLYTACDCVVLPYRGEGFCLPALEALACGRPVIVPDGGPTDDFVDDTVGWRVPASRRPYGDGRIGDWECVGSPWLFEIDREALAAAMQEAYAKRDLTARRGAEAASRVQQHWTWDRSHAAVWERLQALKATSPSTRLPERTRSRKPDATAPKRKEPAAPSRTPHPATRPVPTISLYLKARPGENGLEAGLQSAQPWVDEMIVIAPGADDQTVAAAKRWGAKVSADPADEAGPVVGADTLPDAAGDWIFWMEARETLPEACGPKLREMAFLAEERTSGFLVQVRPASATGKSDATATEQVRLFRNRPELCGAGGSPEQVLEALQKQGGRVESSPVHVTYAVQGLGSP